MTSVPSLKRDDASRIDRAVLPSGTAARPPVAETDRPALAQPHDEEEPRRWFGITAGFAAAVVLSPFAVAAYSLVHAVGRGGDLNADRAIIALTVRRVWSGGVLLGPYSRFDFHHPGPIYFDLLAIFNTLFGGRTVGVLLGSVVINTAAAAGILVVAHRRGGRALAIWTALVLGLYLLALGPVAFDVWNPSVTLVPFALALLLAWSVACLDVWALPWLVFFGTFLVQTHVGLLPGVVAAAGVGLATAARRQSQGAAGAEVRKSLRRPLLVSSALGAVLWLPPLMQQVTSSDGNLGRLTQFFLRSGSQHSLADALGETASQVTLIVRSVLDGSQLRADSHGTVALGVGLSVAAFAIALALTLKSRGTDIGVLLLLVTVEVGTAVYSVTRIVGPTEIYLVGWISAIGLALWVAVGAAIIKYARRHLGHAILPSVRLAGATALTALIAVVALLGYPGATVTHTTYRDPVLRGALAPVLAATRHEKTVLLRLDAPLAWPELAAVALALEQRGKEVRIVRSPVTELFFDHAASLIDQKPRTTVLAFRDPPDHTLGPGDTHLTDIAGLGRWNILQIKSGSPPRGDPQRH